MTVSHCSNQQYYRGNRTNTLAILYVILVYSMGYMKLFQQLKGTAVYIPTNPPPSSQMHFHYRYTHLI